MTTQVWWLQHWQDWIFKSSHTVHIALHYIKGSMMGGNITSLVSCISVCNALLRNKSNGVSFELVGPKLGVRKPVKTSGCFHYSFVTDWAWTFSIFVTGVVSCVCWDTWRNGCTDLGQLPVLKI